MTSTKVDIVCEQKLFRFMGFQFLVGGYVGSVAMDAPTKYERHHRRSLLIASDWA